MLLWPCLARCSPFSPANQHLTPLDSFKYFCHALPSDLASTQTMDNQENRLQHQWVTLGHQQATG